MRRSDAHPLNTWRVAVTRDEDETGPLHVALRDAGFEPVACPVQTEGPPADAGPLNECAQKLERYDWVICSSARAADAIASARRSPWPPHVRTAAVGERTAAALERAGAVSPPVLARDAGADALWEHLSSLDDWPRRRVLVATTAGGRRTIIDGLRAAGASVDEVEAYRMVLQRPEIIARSWFASRPHAAVVASPSAVAALVAALGAMRLTELKAIVAIGQTTAAALESHGIRADVPSRTDFRSVAARLSSVRAHDDTNRPAPVNAEPS